MPVSMLAHSILGERHPFLCSDTVCQALGTFEGLLGWVRGMPPLRALSHWSKWLCRVPSSHTCPHSHPRTMKRRRPHCPLGTKRSTRTTMTSKRARPSPRTSCRGSPSATTSRSSFMANRVCKCTTPFPTAWLYPDRGPSWTPALTLRRGGIVLTGSNPTPRAPTSTRGR